MRNYYSRDYFNMEDSCCLADVSSEEIPMSDWLRARFSRLTHSVHPSCLCFAKRFFSRAQRRLAICMYCTVPYIQ